MGVLDACATVVRNFGAASITLADQFNAFFSSAGQATHAHSESASRLQSISESAFLPFCTEDDLRCILFSFKTNKAAGIDGISVAVLCGHFERLKHVLLAIINNIVDTQTVPVGLKNALVKPLHENGSNICVMDYRGISIPPTIALILEKTHRSSDAGFSGCA